MNNPKIGKKVRYVEPYVSCRITRQILCILIAICLVFISEHPPAPLAERVSLSRLETGFLTIRGDVDISVPVYSRVTAEIAASLFAFDVNIGDSTIRQLTAEARGYNQDTVGWLYIPKTVINYPILQRPYGDDFYLTHNFDGEESAEGAIYLEDSLDIHTSEVILLHGHSMKNKTMFGELLGYKQSSWADERKQIFLFDGLTVKEYEVFACILLNASNEDLIVRFRSESERDMYYDRIINRSLLEYGEVQNPGDVLVLNTCSYEADNFRCLVFASQVKKDGESEGL